MQSTFPEGKTSATTCSSEIPIFFAITRAVRMLSPVSMYTSMPRTFWSTFIVAAASFFSLSIKPKTASVSPSTDTTTAVSPLFSKYSIALNVPLRGVIWLSSILLLFPICTVRPSTTHLTPMPVSLTKSSAGISRLPFGFSVELEKIPMSSALARIPFARGCSLPCSAQAARNMTFSIARFEAATFSSLQTVDSVRSLLLPSIDSNLRESRTISSTWGLP
mmetsp:Transcript_3545/g.6872  ORF Transcript_3545/g.6872 Transcript_3545/m.6872 type:complete len:220 (-) Transcript_3545:54-713(-)